MRFGWFSGSAKRYRDNVLAAAKTCSAEAEMFQEQLAEIHRALSDKLTEVQERLEAKG